MSEATRQIVEGRGQIGKLKDEARRQQAIGHRALAAEQQQRQLAEADSQGRGRHGDHGRTMQHLAQGLGERTVAHRFRRAGIIRTAGVVAVQKKINQGDLILQMDPWHPLPTVADRAAQAEFERQTKRLAELQLALQESTRKRDAAKANVDPYVLAAITRQESGFEPTTVS